MKTLFKSIILSGIVGLLCSLTPSTTFGQTNWMGGLYFNTGFPQGDLKDHIDRNSYGIGGQIFYAPSESPLAIGLDLSWMNYGSETRQEPFSSTIPDVVVDVETSNNIVQSFLVLRGQTPKGPIRLYADGLIGFNYLYTETSIEESGGSTEEIASHTNQDDAVLAYGIGGGVQVPIYRRAADREMKQGALEILLDGGVRYIAGGEADYLKEGSIRREGTAVSFDTINSKTNLLRLHIGVAVRF